MAWPVGVELQTRLAMAMARHSQNGSDDSHDDFHDISGCNF